MGLEEKDEKRWLLQAQSAREVNQAVNDSDPHKNLKETPEEYKKRWRTIRVVYFMMLFGSVEFSIVMSSLWPYLQKVDPNISETFLGWANSGFSLCQLIGSVLFGIWCQRRPAIESLVFAQVVLIIGSMMYGYAQSFNTTLAPYMILIGRLVLGFSTGNVSVCRAVVSQSTTLNERVGAFGNTAIAQAIGFFVGPAVQVAVVPIGNRSYYVERLKMYINIFTLPGFLGVIFGIVNILVLLFYFREQKVDIYADFEGSGKKEVQDEDGEPQKPDFNAIGVTSVLFFILMSVFALNETILTPLMMDQFAWTDKQAVLYGGIILSISGILAICCFHYVKYLAKRYGERPVLALGLVLCLLGFIIYLPWGSQYPKLRTLNKSSLHDSTTSGSNVGCPISYKWCKNTPKLYLPQFLMAATLVGIGYPVGFLVANTIYSRLLGPRKQGTYMGWISAVGATARVCGPLLVSNSYQDIGPRWTFFTVDVILTFAILLLGCNYHRLIPFHEYLRHKKPNII